MKLSNILYRYFLTSLQILAQDTCFCILEFILVMHTTICSLLHFYQNFLLDTIWKQIYNQVILKRVKYCYDKFGFWGCKSSVFVVFVSVHFNKWLNCTLRCIKIGQNRPMKVIQVICKALEARLFSKCLTFLNNQHKTCYKTFYKLYNCKFFGCW